MGPTEEQWAQAIEESWEWFEANLGRTPCAYDVQMWIDGYVPRQPSSKPSHSTA